MSNGDKEGMTHSVDGDTIAVFEWCDDEIIEIEQFVNELSGHTAIDPDTRVQIDIGEDWFEYETYTHIWHNGHCTRHAISYANVPEDVRSAASGIVQDLLNQCGMAIKQVDFENERYILADQSLIESRFPEQNQLIDSE